MVHFLVIALVSFALVEQHSMVLGSPLEEDDTCSQGGNAEGCSVGLLQVGGDAKRIGVRALANQGVLQSTAPKQAEGKENTHASAPGTLRNMDLFDRNLTEEPPRVSKDARFDLPLDLSGKYQVTKSDNTISAQWIWHECLEVTISGNGSYPNGTEIPDSGSPLHHHNANGEYITYDDTQTTTTEVDGYFSYKSIIAAPTKAEAADGATAVLVFYEDTTMPDIINPDGSVHSYKHPQEVAIRYIDSQGRLAFQQNASLIPGSAPFVAMEKVADVSCPHPYTNPESDHCAAKTYNDQYNAFTPACCGDGYDGSTDLYTTIANPAWKAYVADCTTEV